jgi:hypothetical protein
MSVRAEHSRVETQGTGIAGRILVMAGLMCLVAAGLLLWAQQGDSVFSDTVLAALAWCF